MSKFLYSALGKIWIFLYCKSQLSKFLYFESYKFWKLANIKVSIFCNKKNLALSLL